MNAQQNLAEICAKIATSDQFDADWYLQQNPDVATSGIDPILHYVLYGEKEGRNPTPHFILGRHMRPSESCGNILCDNICGAKTEIKHEVAIVFSVNDSFIPLLSVAIASIIFNANTDNIYIIHIVYNNASKEKLKTLVSMSTHNVIISTICISEQIDKFLKNVKVTKRFPKEAWFRLLIPILFKQYEKILYLDCDLVVNNDIANLYNVNITKYMLGAIPDNWRLPSVVRYRQDELCIDSKLYFNSGVLLFNLISFYQNGSVEKGLQLANSGREFPTVDQDVLNIVCNGHVKLLPMKWNWQWTFLSNDGYRYASRDLFAGMASNFEKPAIVHFTSPAKPSSFNDDNFAFMFWRYARYSPFFKTLVRNCPYNLDREIWPKVEKLEAEA